MNGPHSLEELLEIRKAFEANSALDGASPFVAVGSSGATLSMQSLDRTFVATVSTDADFKFLKNLPRRSINQVLAEYNKNTSHGGAWYKSSYIGQSDEPVFRDAVLERLYNEVNYIAEGYSFNKVVDTVANVQDPEIIQSNAALRRGMENMSRRFWYGDRSLCKYEQDGFLSNASKLGSEFLIDARGSLPVVNELKYHSAKIRTDKFGKVNEIWMHPATKALYDQILAPSAAVVLQNQNQSPNNVLYGNIVNGIPDSNAYAGIINFQDDIWMDLHNWGVPMTYDPNGNLIEGPTDPVNSPATPTVAIAVVPNVPGSLFDSTNAGKYGYRVSAGNLKDWSAASLANSVTIPAGGASEITITPGVGSPPETRYAIFRETRPGSNIVRYMTSIARNATGNTVFQDLNEDLPGTTIMVLGDFNSQSQTDDKRTLILSELLGFTKTLFPYGAGGKLRLRQGMIENYSVLQNVAPEKFRVFKNIPVIQ